MNTPMTEMSTADFCKVIDVDLNIPFIMARAVIPSMIKKGGGKIILRHETVSGYVATKGGLKMLIKNICSEFG